MSLQLSLLATLSLTVPTTADGDPVVLDVSQDSYAVGQDISIDVAGGPSGGMAVWLLDYAPGPATAPNVGTLAVGLSPSLVVVPLPPIEQGYTFSCGPIDCDFPLLNTPLYMQVVAFSPTGEACLSNGDVLLVEDGGACELTGCSPGYWKTHPQAWGPTGYSPDDDFDTVFGLDLFDPDQTLHQVIQPPATVAPLEFHAVAALLNAAHPDETFPLAPLVVIQLTADAFVSGNAQLVEDQKDVFDAFNNENCTF